MSFVCPSASRLIARKIGRFDLRLYAASAYLERHGTPESVSDLQDHLFVDYIDDLVQIPAVRWLHDAVQDPQVVFRSSSMVAQQNAAAAGIGLVVLPSFTGARDKRLRPLLTDQRSIKRDLWLAVHEDLRNLSRVKALTEFLGAEERAADRLRRQGYLTAISLCTVRTPLTPAVTRPARDTSSGALTKPESCTRPS